MGTRRIKWWNSNHRLHRGIRNLEWRHIQRVQRWSEHIYKRLREWIARWLLLLQSESSELKWCIDSILGNVWRVRACLEQEENGITFID